jgi:hypothetical protein
LAKTLCSFDFVRDTYLLGPSGRLPDVPWLAERTRIDVAQPLRGARAAGGA